MSTQFIYSNFFSTSLAAPITSSGQTTITISSTTNAPAITAGQNWVIALNDAATQTIYEVLIATARTGNVLTVLRGQEGTAATTWLAGDNVYAPDTAGILNNFALINGSTANNFSVAALTMAGALSGGTTSSFSGVGTAQSFSVTGAGLSAAQVGISNDGLAVAGLVFNTITSSTNGFSWVVNGNIAAPLATLSAVGAFLNTGVISAGKGTQYGSISAGDLGASRSTTTGVVRIGGSNTSVGIDWNITTGGEVSFVTAASAYPQINAGQYNNLSDRALKSDIAPIASGIDEILALTPVSFTWKKGTLEPFVPPQPPPILPDNPTDEDLANHAAELAHQAQVVAEHEAFVAEFEALPEKPGFGFVAQDVEKVLPVLVSTNKKGLKGVNYDGIIPFLVKAFQEEHAVRVGMQAALKAAGIKGF